MFISRALRRNPPVDECVRGGREGVYDLVLVPQVKEETATSSFLQDAPAALCRELPWLELRTTGAFLLMVLLITLPWFSITFLC